MTFAVMNGADALPGLFANASLPLFSPLKTRLLAMFPMVDAGRELFVTSTYNNGDGITVGKLLSGDPLESQYPKDVGNAGGNHEVS